MDPLSTTTTSSCPGQSVASRCVEAAIDEPALFQQRTTARTRSILFGSITGGSYEASRLPPALEGGADALLDGLEALADERADDVERAAGLLGLRADRLGELVAAHLEALERDHAEADGDEAASLTAAVTSSRSGF